MSITVMIPRAQLLAHAQCRACGMRSCIWPTSPPVHKGRRVGSRHRAALSFPRKGCQNGSWVTTALFGRMHILQMQEMSSSCLSHTEAAYPVIYLKSICAILSRKHPDGAKSLSKQRLRPVARPARQSREHHTAHLVPTPIVPSRPSAWSSVMPCHHLFFLAFFLLAVSGSSTTATPRLFLHAAISSSPS
ncbi:unnamed protein product [Periconia digitata]|uniref:Uncharacterized protein n=1 Tax=Periconia digitata TaxID=1303443 RepID=A0A9W4UMW9_9PLEO|nr:unnamed protein product [Periconia digitata]